MLEKIKKSADYILSQINCQAKTAIVLGTGLGAFINQVEIVKQIPYSTIPHFPKTSVEGHSGMLIHAKHNGIDLLIMQGRVHFYEAGSMEMITYPIRVLKSLEIKNIVLSNAVGGLNEQHKVGDLMIITDHINLMPNPLVGKHHPEFGERFPDMSEAYDSNYVKLAEGVAVQNNIKIHKGIYVAVTGPTYETPAEYKYIKIIGGDVVGMSTVPEVIVARQMGIKCFAMSVITDLGVPGKIEYLTHEFVQKAANLAEPKMAKIVKDLITLIQ
jgi:purine-nucleoside phosphorylase